MPRKKGGAFLGKGAAGCAFSPVIPCANGTTFPNGTVGKVIQDSHDSQIEWKISVNVNAADPGRVYTNTPLGECKVLRSKIMEVEPEFEKCREILKPDYVAFPQIVYPHKGVALNNIDLVTTDMFAKANFPGIVHLANGIAMLSRNKIAHMDLKLDNIIRMSDNKLIMIDFGLSTRFDKFYSDENGMLTPDYFAFPPEFKIFNVFVSGMWMGRDDMHPWLPESSKVDLTNIDKLATYMKKKTLQTMLVGDEFINTLFPKFGFTMRERNEQIKAVFKRLLKNGLPDPNVSVNTHTFESDMNKYVNRVDVYAFGIAMLMMYLDSPVMNSDPPTPFSTRCAEIIKSCLHTDPLDRPTPDELATSLASAYYDAYNIGTSKPVSQTTGGRVRRSKKNASPSTSSSRRPTSKQQK